jgi:hypothetical protein
LAYNKDRIWNQIQHNSIRKESEILTGILKNYCCGANVYPNGNNQDSKPLIVYRCAIKGIADRLCRSIGDTSYEDDLIKMIGSTY